MEAEIMGHALSLELKLDSGINLNMSSLWLNMAPQWSLSRQMMVWARQSWSFWKCCRLLQDSGKKKKETRKRSRNIHFLNRLHCSGFVGLEPILVCIGLPDEDRKSMHTYREHCNFLHLTWMSLDCGKKVDHK